jgi:hypothetical protein
VSRGYAVKNLLEPLAPWGLGRINSAMGFELKPVDGPKSVSAPLREVNFPAFFTPWHEGIDGGISMYDRRRNPEISRIYPVVGIRIQIRCIRRTYATRAEARF